MNEWKKRERELNAKYEASKKGKLIHQSFVPVMYKGRQRWVGNTYRKGSVAQ